MIAMAANGCQAVLSKRTEGGAVEGEGDDAGASGGPRKCLRADGLRRGLRSYLRIRGADGPGRIERLRPQVVQAFEATPGRRPVVRVVQPEVLGLATRNLRVDPIDGDPPDVPESAARTFPSESKK